MKKIVLSIAILLMATTVFAKRPTGMNLGGGYVSNFTTMFSENQSYFGGFAEIGYNLKLGNVSGLYFGARADALFSGKYVYGNVKMDATTRHIYLDVPVKYSFMTPGRTKFFFEIGPTVSFWLDARTHIDKSVSPSASFQENINWFDDTIFNRVNLYLGGNIGVMIGGHVKVYSGYDLGLFSYTKKDVGYNNIGQLRVGFAWVW